MYTGKNVFRWCGWYACLTRVLSTQYQNNPAYCNENGIYIYIYTYWWYVRTLDTPPYYVNCECTKPHDKNNVGIFALKLHSYTLKECGIYSDNTYNVSNVFHTIQTLVGKALLSYMYQNKRKLYMMSFIPVLMSDVIGTFLSPEFRMTISDNALLSLNEVAAVSIKRCRSPYYTRNHSEPFSVISTLHGALGKVRCGFLVWQILPKAQLGSWLMMQALFAQSQWSVTTVCRPAPGPLFTKW